MRFSSMPPLKAGIFSSYMDYNLTVDCLQTALQANKLKLCRNIPGADVAERMAVILFQVRK
jgi:hypothetical protein